MDTISCKHRNTAFTIWDLLIVVVTLALLCLLLPMYPACGGKTARPRIGCASNLKQIGLGLRVWSEDHGEKFPMAVSKNTGGSLEFAESGQVFRHFLAISNELSSPGVLTCPSEKTRKRATNFAEFSNRNLSYFLGLDALEAQPQMLLSGDRNLSTNGRIMSGLLDLRNTTNIAWTDDIHRRCGNIGLGDGSAALATTSQLQQQASRTTNSPARIAIP